MEIIFLRSYLGAVKLQSVSCEQSSFGHGLKSILHASLALFDLSALLKAEKSSHHISR